MSEHYICTGTCGGVSENPGVCQDETCPKHGESLTACGCESLEHQTGSQTQDNDSQ